MASSPKPLVLSLMHDSVLLAFTLLAPTFIESQRAMADDVNEQRLQARVQPVVIIACHGRSSSWDLRRNIPRIPQVPNDPTVVRDPLTQRVIRIAFCSLLFVDSVVRRSKAKHREKKTSKKVGEEGALALCVYVVMMVMSINVTIAEFHQHRPPTEHSKK